MRSLLAEQVAATVRAELARQRKTQRDLAAALGISQQTVSRRLAGETPFAIDEIEAAARFLGVSVGALVQDMAA